MHFRGVLYRVLNPLRARDPLSGEGARLHGGRFNPKGVAALYTSLSVMTAVREANQIGALQPTTLVSCQADIAPVFDATDPAALQKFGLTPADLAADDWRLRMRAGGMAPPQRLAGQLIAGGHSGMLVQSFAAGSGSGDLNLVLWAWGTALPAQLVLIDDEGRLRP